jgi:glycosyltransferase involved in cell wall biosynthesis
VRVSKPLRVGLDASSAVTGGGLTYLKQMLLRLGSLEGVDLVAVLARAEHMNALETTPDRTKLLWTNARLGAVNKSWREALRTFRVQVVLAPTEIGHAPSEVPLVLALRNAALRPSVIRSYRGRTRGRLATKYLLARWSLRRAHEVIAVSRFASAVGQSSLGVPHNKITVVYHGGPSNRNELRQAKPVRKFLCVSDVYRYKNYRRLFRAFATLPSDCRLDVVGAPVETDYWSAMLKDVAELNLEDRISFHGPVTDVDGFYRDADCFLWPSYLEVFGHPLVEAHSHGLPILAADAASNREVAGQAAEYFDPFSVSDMSSSLLRAYSTGITIGQLPREYSWESCAKDTARVLVRVAERHQSP